MGLTKPGRGRVTIVDEDSKWSEELLAEARELLDEDVIAEGGDYRASQYDVSYWLDLPHLVEFEKADQRIKSDKEFWRWYTDYRAQHKIYSSVKGGGSWSSKPYDPGSYTKTSDKNYMTGWWGKWSWKGEDSNTTALALAVGAVQSIVSVINNTQQKFRVKLSSDGDSNNGRNEYKSYTSFDEKLVVVSPSALMDKSIDQEKGIKITAGFGLHEASHVEYSGDSIDAMRRPTQLSPIALVSLLANVLEDLRIESLTSEKFPGFAQYFETANGHLWDVQKPNAPKTWGGELRDKVNAIILMTKWAEDFRPLVDASGDQRLKDEFQWFNDWAGRYPSDGSGLRDSLIEALNHLREDEETSEQMDKATADEEAMGGSGKLTDEQFRAFIDELKELLKGGGTLIDPCPSTGTGVELTEDQAAEIDELIRQELTEFDPQLFGTTNTGQYQREKAYSIRPPETDESRNAFVKPGPLVARMKQAFVFRKKAPEWAERVQRSGDLDEDMLWRIAGNDLRVFERKVIEEIPRTQVTLLVDMSGSMAYGRVEEAQQVATTMIACLSTMRGVTARVRGFSDDDVTYVYKIWEPGDPLSRLGLISVLGQGGTPEGFAVDWCSKELIENHKPGEDMVLLTLADGGPNAALYPMSGADHVRKVNQYYKKMGVSSISISMDSGLSQATQAYMYENYIPYAPIEHLPHRMTRMLAKLFGGAI